jgi:hypothetical protein
MTIMMNMPNMDILLQENAVLSKELGKLQERSNRLLAEKSKEIELLRQQLAVRKRHHMIHFQANADSLANRVVVVGWNLRQYPRSAGQAQGV